MFSHNQERYIPRQLERIIFGWMLLRPRIFEPTLHNKLSSSSSTGERNFLIAAIFEYDPINAFQIGRRLRTSTVNLLTIISVPLVLSNSSVFLSHSLYFSLVSPLSLSFSFFLFFEYLFAPLWGVSPRCISSPRSINFKRPPLFQIFNPRGVKTRNWRRPTIFLWKPRLLSAKR